MRRRKDEFDGDRHDLDLDLDLDLDAEDKPLLPSSRKRGKPKQRFQRRVFYGLVFVLVATLCVTLGLGVAERWHRVSMLHPMVNFISRHEMYQIKGSGLKAMVNVTAEDQRMFGLNKEATRAVLGTVFVDVLRRDSRLLGEYLQGAHLVACGKAGAAFYDQFKALDGSYPRPVSSHFSSNPQVCIPQGRIMDSILVGTIPASRLPSKLARGSDSIAAAAGVESGGEGEKGGAEGTKMCTWVQLEGAEAGRNLVEFALHSLDFFAYLFSGMRRNIGPCGSSNVTEANPLVVNI